MNLDRRIGRILVPRKHGLLGSNFFVLYNLRKDLSFHFALGRQERLGYRLCVYLTRKLTAVSLGKCVPPGNYLVYQTLIFALIVLRARFN